MELRPYQQEAVDAIREQIGDGEAPGKVRSTLLVMPTGTGKSVCITDVVANWRGQGRVLVLAHRSELVDQLKAHIEGTTGELCDVEQAERFAYSARVVVGSMKSVGQRRRLHRMGYDFGLVIIDEAHRSKCATYLRIIDHFHRAKVLGVTATPDRGDKKPLGDVFETVAYQLDILEAIQGGWLVPVKARRVFLEAIDISQVKATAGDLQIGQLDKAMVEAAAGLAEETIKTIGPEDGQGIAFLPGIESGMLVTSWLNKLRPDCARFVCGTTDKDVERPEIFRAFRAGEFQFLVNVDVATEGFDHPPATWCIMGRGTKSRGRYAQAAGRVTRPLKGVVDQWPTATERRDAIAESAKPHCVILDFYGNTGKHDLCTPADLLGGSYTEAELKEAKKHEGGDKPENVADALAEARSTLKRVAAEHEARVKARQQEVNAFYASGDEEPEMPKFKRGIDPNAATQKQLGKLWRLGVKHIEGLTKAQASNLIDKYKELQNGRATDAQRRRLEKVLDEVPANTPFTLARNGLNYLEACRRFGGRVDPERLRSLITPGA